MRRRVLNIAAALLALLAGLLTAVSYKNLAYALPLSLLTFFIVKVLPRLEIDLHFLMVTVMSLLLWAAGASVFLSHFTYEGGSCVLDFRDGSNNTTVNLKDNTQLLPTDKPLSEILSYSCGGADISPPVTNSVWAGVVDKKALTKPKPHHPPIAKAARAEGTVAVWVLINESGTVLWSQAISGPPLLKQPAMRAACSARFSPLLFDGPPVKVSGILTYKFAP